MSKEDLKKNIATFRQSAELVYQQRDYTSATILYFKTLFVVLDLILLEKCAKTPKDHSERFRMLEKEEPELYFILDTYFEIYRDTYTTTIDKESCDYVRKELKTIMEERSIS